MTVTEGKPEYRYQSAYRILAASTRERLEANQGDLWDSGKVASDRSLHVPTGQGPDLASGLLLEGADMGSERRAFRVERDGRLRDGRAEPRDWEARWITVPGESEEKAEPVPLTDWIWHPEGAGDNQTVCFRRSLVLDESVLAAISPSPRTTGTWPGSTVARWARTTVGRGGDLQFKGGPAFHARNPHPGREGREPGRFLGTDRRHPAAAEERRRGAARRAGALEVRRGRAEGWREPGFDDTAWAPAKKLAAAGEAPWGSLSQDQGKPRRRGWCAASSPCRAGDPGPVHVSGLGFYVLRINGRKASEDVFTPGWTSIRNGSSTRATT